MPIVYRPSSSVKVIALLEVRVSSKGGILMATLSRPTAGRASAWAVGTRQVVFMAIGAALYGVLGWVTSFLRIPGPFNSQIRPAVVIPMFFGAIFGPWVGFFTGFVGNVIIDLLSGYGFSWNWSLGNGLLGLI